MASGRPDWHSLITIEGWDGNNFQPILVRETGQLFVLLQGIYNLLPKTVALDTGGYLYAILKGMTAGGLETVALDDTHAIKANLVAQDVAKLYAYVTSGKSETLSYTGATSNMLTADGPSKSAHGTIQGGYVAFQGGVGLVGREVEFKIDGVTHGKHTIQKLLDMGHVKGRGYPFSIITCPGGGSEYVTFQFAYDIGFDTSFQFLLYNNFDVIAYHCDIHYALTPAA
ncbi:hypothetical protein ES703_64056 [subsurface metagenome]